MVSVEEIQTIADENIPAVGNTRQRKFKKCSATQIKQQRKFRQWSAVVPVMEIRQMEIQTSCCICSSDGNWQQSMPDFSNDKVQMKTAIPLREKKPSAKIDCSSFCCSALLSQSPVQAPPQSVAEVPNNQPEIKSPEANNPSLEGKVAQVERS